MADSFKKKAVTEESTPEKPADAWKDAVVEKEHQPVKVKSEVTYRQMEHELANIAAQVKSLGDRKAVVEAEMAEIKKAAQG